MPVYDKPMIYYPLTTLMLAGIREVLVITTPHDATPIFAVIASRWGAMGRSQISAMPSSPSPRGLAQAYTIGADFVAGGPSCLVLGDNIFFGHGLPDSRCKWRGQNSLNGASVFAYQVADPGTLWRGGEFDADRAGDQH